MGLLDNMNMCDPSSTLYQTNSIKDNFMRASDYDEETNYANNHHKHHKKNKTKSKSKSKSYFNPRGFMEDED